jgi:[protein-PII] uridylyltransferase
MTFETHAEIADYLLDEASLDHLPATEDRPLLAFKKKLHEADGALKELFRTGTAVSLLVPARAAVMDKLLRALWRWMFPGTNQDIALIAVGGYGRGELHPCSDIDFMILLDNGAEARHQGNIEKFLMLLWDMGLDIGHAVRTLDDCEREAAGEITIATNLMESRHLIGNETLFHEMRERTQPTRIWPSHEFFAAKYAEQKERHRKFNNTAYNLEPNIKENPGGLRDIQMIGWVAKRHFGLTSLHDLVTHGFLTESEYDTLIQEQNFIWAIRFALHITTGRKEDRLLFDYQRTLAERFGFHDKVHSLAVEQLMQRYYRTVMELSRLNEMLLQLFEETILGADEETIPQVINPRFQVVKGYLEASHPKVFRQRPFALLEVFLLMQQNPEIKGVRAQTVRMIRDHLHLIDDKFRADIRARGAFIEILRQPQSVLREIRRMHRYGLLGAYLPAFTRITGRMQYDLFHIYTVDEHTLFVVNNLERYGDPEFAHEFPTCSKIFHKLPKRDLLFIAGLFHDIAKGRGGDHSELGETDALDFCKQHGYSPHDCRLVSWLVRHHLVMSTTAQKKDISDPDVVAEFARKAGDVTHLNYLYLLTVADIRGTNGKLWNSWKDTLLLDLYTQAKRTLRRGLENPIDKDELIAETQTEAIKILTLQHADTQACQGLWRSFTDDYFLRCSADEVAWHTQRIVTLEHSYETLVMIRESADRGGNELFIYAPDKDNLFAITCQLLDKLGLTILDARIITSLNGQTLDSYLVLEADGSLITHEHRRQEITSAIQQRLTQDLPLEPPVRRPLPRELKHFHVKTQITFGLDEKNNRTTLELIANDRPGLLSRVGYLFAQHGVRVQNAKIATMGERAEDVFFITDRQNQPIADANIRDALCSDIVKALDTQSS